MLALLRDCRDSILQGLIALSILFIVFSLLERVFAISRSKKPWRSTLLDLQYAFLSMLYPPCVYFVLSAVFGAVERSKVERVSPPDFAAQLIILLLIRDSLIYLRHRVFHLRPVWPFHSIHHGSEEVNWLSAARFHPAENIIETIGETVLFLTAAIMGFNPAVMAVAAMVIGVYNFFIHSNLSWTFGPLRFVFVSPIFHRWHHSDSIEAQDKNFASMFSFIDLLFGTFYMPKNSVPITTGLSGEEKETHPRSLIKQVIHPFT